MIPTSYSHHWIGQKTRDSRQLILKNGTMVQMLHFKAQDLIPIIFYWWISAQQIFEITNREVNYLSASRSDANWNRFQCQKGCEHWQHCKKRQQFSAIPIAYQNLCFNILYRWVWWLKFYCRLSLWMIARDAFRPKPLTKKMNKCENQINCNLVTPTTKGKRRNLRIPNGCHLV